MELDLKYEMCNIYFEVSSYMNKYQEHLSLHFITTISKKILATDPHHQGHHALIIFEGTWVGGGGSSCDTQQPQ